MLALATSFGSLPIIAAAGTAAPVGWGIEGWLAWLLAALPSTWIYLSVAALEVAFARMLHVTVSDTPPERR